MRRKRKNRRRPPAPRVSIQVPVGKVLLSTAAGIVAALLIVGAREGAKWLAMHPSLAVREVEVVGVGHVDADRVRELANIEPGDPWLLVDRAWASFRISSEPWIERARVRRPSPGKVRLVIEECVPVARVRVGGREYGLSESLRILPEPGEESASLPLILGPIEEDPMFRGAEYAQAIRELALAGEGTVELLLGAEFPDRIRLPEHGLEVSIEEPISPRSAVQNVAAFLETLDGEGASRGTLRLISEATAVWEAAA